MWCLQNLSIILFCNYFLYITINKLSPSVLFFFIFTFFSFLCFPIILFCFFMISPPPPLHRSYNISCLIFIKHARGTRDRQYRRNDNRFIQYVQVPNKLIKVSLPTPNDGRDPCFASIPFISDRLMAADAFGTSLRSTKPATWWDEIVDCIQTQNWWTL